MLTRASISKFIFSLLLIGLSCNAWAKGSPVTLSVEAQVDSAAQVEPPTTKTKIPVYQGTYLSVDIFNPIATAWNDGKFEVSISSDVSLWHRLFPRLELGMMTVHQHPEAYDYKSTGLFAKLGANYNFINFKNDRKYDHALYAGIHYAYSYTEYQLSNAQVGGSYWGETATTSTPLNSCHFGWLEFQVGVRVQIYRGFFMGLALNIKTFGHYYQPAGEYPTYIPGYGVDYGSTNFGFEYTLTYQIPSKSRPRAPKPPKAPKVKEDKEDSGFF